MKIEIEFKQQAHRNPIYNNESYDLPIFNDGIADWVVRVVIGSCLAGLHKQLCVGDGGCCLDLHEDHLFEVHLHWINAGILLSHEALAVKEFKLEGESTKTFLCEGVRIFVSVSQSHFGSLWVDTGEGDLDVMLPGNDFTWVSRCDLIFEDDVVFILLKVKRFKLPAVVEEVLRSLRKRINTIV